METPKRRGAPALLAQSCGRRCQAAAPGSTVLITDAKGEVVSRTIYRPYGQAVAPTTSAPPQVPEFGFTGQRFETSLGIYDYRARFYDPALGRFLQPDSIIGLVLGVPLEPQRVRSVVLVAWAASASQQRKLRRRLADPQAPALSWGASEASPPVRDPLSMNS